MKAELARALEKAAAAGLPEYRLMTLREMFSRPGFMALPADQYLESLNEHLDRHTKEHQAVLASPAYQHMARLEAAFFGTLEPRPDSSRPRHKKDGWRDGHSHPLDFEGQTYDVITPSPAEDASEHEKKVAEGLAADATRAQYEYLKVRILIGR